MPETCVLLGSEPASGEFASALPPMKRFKPMATPLIVTPPRAPYAADSAALPRLPSSNCPRWMSETMDCAPSSRPSSSAEAPSLLATSNAPCGMLSAAAEAILRAMSAPSSPAALARAYLPVLYADCTQSFEPPAHTPARSIPAFTRAAVR